MSSGHYSKGKKGTFQPFFGIFAAEKRKDEINNSLKYLEKLLQIPPEDALSNDKTYKYFLKKHEPHGTGYKLFTTPNLIKCMYIHLIANLFESEQPKKIINNQTIFSNEYSTNRGANAKLCNPYFEKYSKALGLYFWKNKINIDSINDITMEKINELISINSVFGVNLTYIPTLDTHFSDVMDKIDEYEQVFWKLWNDLERDTTVDFYDTFFFKHSKFLKNIIEYFREGKLFSKQTDLLHFYNAYYNVNHKDHEEVLEIIKDNLYSQLSKE